MLPVCGKYAGMGTRKQLSKWLICHTNERTLAASLVLTKWCVCTAAQQYQPEASSWSGVHEPSRPIDDNHVEKADTRTHAHDADVEQIELPQVDS